MVFGITPYSATINIPQPCLNEWTKSTVSSLLQQQLKQALPSNLPSSGKFFHCAYNNHKVFYYANPVACSSVNSSLHAKFYSATVCPIEVTDHYTNIGAGSSYVSTSTAMFSMEDDNRVHIYVPKPASLNTPVDVSEPSRTSRMYDTLQEYLRTSSKPIKASKDFQTDMKNTSPFSGGGDMNLYSSDGTRSAIVINVEEDSDNEGWVHTNSAVVENKIAQYKVESMLKQLKANMILSSTLTWCAALQQSNAGNIHQFVATTKIVCFGLLVGLGKPLVLYKSTMNFVTNQTIFEQLACYEWSVVAPFIVDSALSYIIKQLMW